MIDISNSSSMLEDWNRGVSCVGQSVQDVEVETFEMSRMMMVLKQITTKIVNGDDNE